MRRASGRLPGSFYLRNTTSPTPRQRFRAEPQGTHILSSHIHEWWCAIRCDSLSISRVKLKFFNLSIISSLFSPPTQTGKSRGMTIHTPWTVVLVKTKKQRKPANRPLVPCISAKGVAALRRNKGPLGLCPSSVTAKSCLCAAVPVSSLFLCSSKAIRKPK